MNRIWTLTLSVAVALFCGVQSSYAVGTLGPGLYQLHDHGFANHGPNYGLRADAIGAFFSVDLGGADVKLNWDGGPTATITGTVHNNATTQLWDVDFTLTGVVADGTVGFYSAGGTGTLTDPSNNVTILTGLQDSANEAFRLAADGHRIPNDDDTPVGRGWLLPIDSVDDWIVTAELIPEPASLAMLASGGLLLLRRRV